MVSVVLPIRNEARFIKACLERFLEQDYPRDRMEILVIDGSSDDETVAMVRDFQAQHPEANLRLFDNVKRIVPTALNIGIGAAKGNVIVRMDGHSFPAHDYVSKCVAALRQSGAANAGGVLELVGATPFGRAVALASGHPLGAGDARYRVGGVKGFVDTVAFGAFPRAVFEHVGLFDESLVRNQDDEMNMRLRAAGKRVFFDPSIRVQYSPRGTVRGLWSQYFQYGWWRLETMKRHPRALRWRQALPPAMVAAFAGAAVVAPFWSVAAIGLLVASVVYTATVAVVAMRLSVPHARPPLVALAFGVMHFAYGSGFLIHVLTRGRFPYRADPPSVPSLEAHISLDTEPKEC